MKNSEAYESRLEEWFATNPKVLVALSGGVDSCLVAWLARKYNGKEGAVSLIGVSPSLKQRDLELAKRFCTTHDIEYKEIYPKEMENESYASNPVDRCYHCKSELYKEMIEIQKEDFPNFIICNGNNYSDRKDYRPGMQAASEYNSLSPLADCQLEKDMIRFIAEKYKLEVWDKPASPCMSSRFPYGESINADKLKMVEEAEELIFAMNFSDVRVRYVNGDARIEVPADEVARLKVSIGDVEDLLKDLGFGAIEIDEEGLVSGKLNRGIVTEGK